MGAPVYAAQALIVYLRGVGIGGEQAHYQPPPVGLHVGSDAPVQLRQLGGADAVIPYRVQYLDKTLVLLAVYLLQLEVLYLRLGDDLGIKEVRPGVVG